MGTLRSFTNWSHIKMVNDVLLGDPIEVDGDPATFEWDDARIPNGIIAEDGTVIPDEPPAPEPGPVGEPEGNPVPNEPGPAPE